MQILIRPLYSLTNRAKINEEMIEDAIIWTDSLIGVVPVKRLKECWDLARDRQQGSFAPNFFDVKNAWSEIAAQEARRAENDRKLSAAERCSGRQYHATKKGEIVAQNPHTGEDDLYPCPLCRKDDLEKVRKTQIAFFGEIPAKPLTPQQAVEKITRTAEVYLSEAEAREIVREYNALVCDLVADVETRKALFVFFDESANRFRYSGSAAPYRLFTVEDVRKIIADYKNRLEAKERHESGKYEHDFNERTNLSGARNSALFPAAQSNNGRHRAMPVLRFVAHSRHAGDRLFAPRRALLRTQLAMHGRTRSGDHERRWVLS
ncbi:MAG TPA: hypothetical protein VIL74_08895 [Pyrinomonadaceae bacterium]|jgi:hypothetical protein